MGTDEGKKGGRVLFVREYFGSWKEDEGVDAMEADVRGVVDAIDDPDELESFLLVSTRMGGSMMG